VASTLRARRSLDVGSVPSSSISPISQLGEHTFGNANFGETQFSNTQIALAVQAAILATPSPQASVAWTPIRFRNRFPSVR
jgi:hypothetical protein